MNTLTRALLIGTGVVILVAGLVGGGILAKRSGYKHAIFSVLDQRRQAAERSCSDNQMGQVMGADLQGRAFSFAAFAREVQLIETGECPADFQAAWARYAGAVANVETGRALENFNFGPSGLQALNILHGKSQSSLPPAAQPIRLAWEDLERVIPKYGIQFLAEPQSSASAASPASIPSPRP